MSLLSRLFGREKALSAVDGSRGWWSILREPYSGAWQRNDEERLESVLTYGPAFSCITLIANDISKMRLRLVAQDDNRIWQETDAPAFSPVLRKPNGFQNRIQFVENWLLSKLTRGNTYVLKQRDNRGVVVAMYVLNPDLVTPLVSDDGSVFYRLRKDNLAGQTEDDFIVPAREIIHDRINCLYHPLVGLSPIHASAVAAGQGLRIQRTSSQFFANGARPSGVLTAPGEIAQDTATRLKEYWETNFSGDNAAKVAVLGDGLKYEAMTMTSVDAQLIEQLKWTAETVCSCFHVPAFLVGVGQQPTYNNVEALWQQYYSQCLQIHIESLELCLDEGLGIGAGVKVNGSIYGTEFDLDDLLRMDQATQIKSLTEGLKGIFTPDEARAKLGLVPKPGGDQVYLQQQNYSIEALAKRDAKDDPFATGSEAPALPAPANDDETERQAAALIESFRKGLGNAS